jgi:hypothetical protein
MSAHDHLGAPLPYPGRVAGEFALPPKGIVLHSSRSGCTLTPAGEPWTTMHEFQSTCNWAKNAANEYGWNVTVGPNVWAAHMRPTQYGINCGTKASGEYLAVEFSQALLGQPIVQEQVTAFAAMWRDYIVPVWPHLAATEAANRLLLPAHSEMPQGVADGKTDPWPKATAELDQFRARLRAALKGPAVNPWWDQIGPGLAAAIRQRGDEPMSKERYIKDADGQDAISIVAGRQRGYIWWPDSKRVTVISYDPLVPPG